QAPETLETPTAAEIEEPESPAPPPPPDEPRTATPDNPPKQPPTSAPRRLSRRQALTVLGVGARALIAEQALVADRRPPRRRPVDGPPPPPRPQRLRARRPRGPRRPPAAHSGKPAGQPVPPEPGQEHRLPAVPRPRTHAPLLPPQLRRNLRRRAARRLGE